MNRKARPMTGADPGREFVQSLSRGFAVIKAFSQETPSLSLARVADRAGLTRAAARRYLLTLKHLEYVEERNGRFALMPRILDLGFTYLSSMALPSLAQPHMERVASELHESCSISVLDGYEIVYVARVPAKRIMSINLAIGSRLPAHATSMGKVLLAHLSPEELDAFFERSPLQRLTPRTIVKESELREVLRQVREKGWAIVDGESEEGIRSVAAPLYDHTGCVRAAMNVSGHASRVSLVELRGRYLPVLLDAARAICRAPYFGAARAHLPGPHRQPEQAKRNARSMRKR